MCGIWSCVFGGFALLALTVFWAGSCCHLAQSCWGGGFFPQFSGFRASFGAFCSFSGIFSACACVPWLTLWCCLFAPYAAPYAPPTLRPSPAVAGLVIFAADLLTGYHCVCVWVLCGAAELCLLSLLLLGAGLAVVEPLAGVCFCSSSCGACGLSLVFLPQVTLRGYANFSGSSCLSCSCGGALSVGFAVSLVRHLVFHLVPCSSSGACGFGQLPLPKVALWGLCLFCHCIPGLLLRWWLRLGCRPSLVFSVFLLRRLACWGSLGSAPCVRVLPWGL